MDEDKAGANDQTTELQPPHAQGAKGDDDGEEGKARQAEPSLGLARHLEPAEKLYLALALSRILRANLASCLRRDLAFDVLGLDTLRDTEGAPQLALQLLRTLYRFAEAYERGSSGSGRSRLPRDLLHAVGRQMAETAAILLQTEFRPATAALFLDLLLRPSSSSSSSSSAAATPAEAGAHSLLLTMFLADACSTSLSALDATLFACPAAPPAAATTTAATIADCDFRRPLQVRVENADNAENTVDRAAEVAASSDSRPPAAASALSPTQQPRRRLSRGGATAGDHMQTEGDNKEEAEEAEEAAGAGGGSNAVVEAALTLLARDMERAVPPTTPEAACLWSPVGPDLLSLQFLKLYQHRALTALALPPRPAATAADAATTAAAAPPAASLAYFAFYGSHPTEPATAAAAATPHSEWDLPRDGAARLKVEAELHHYLRRLLALSLASLSALAASLPAPSEAEAGDLSAEARRINRAVAAMHATATGQLLLPFLRLASRNQLACPLFLKPLSTLLRPLRTLHAFLLRYRPPPPPPPSPSSPFTHASLSCQALHQRTGLWGYQRLPRLPHHSGRQDDRRRTPLLPRRDD
jgi:hypothetical protein